MDLYPPPPSTFLLEVEWGVYSLVYYAAALQPSYEICLLAVLINYDDTF